MPGTPPSLKPTWWGVPGIFMHSRISLDPVSDKPISTLFKDNLGVLRFLGINDHNVDRVKRDLHVLTFHLQSEEYAGRQVVVIPSRSDPIPIIAIGILLVLNPLVVVFRFIPLLGVSQIKKVIRLSRFVPRH